MDKACNIQGLDSYANQTIDSRPSYRYCGWFEHGITSQSESFGILYQF